MRCKNVALSFLSLEECEKQREYWANISCQARLRSFPACSGRAEEDFGVSSSVADER